MTRRLWLIDARWEHTHETVADAKFFTVKTVMGATEEDAKREAFDYMRHVLEQAQLPHVMTWLRGSDGHCYNYDYSEITLRVRQG